MREIHRGEIYWIEKGEYKKHPAVIVSNEKNNQFSNYVEIVFLTSGSKRIDLPTHAVIYSSGRESTALCETITNVPKESLKSYIAQCTPEEMERIDRCMMVSLGLDDYSVEYESFEDETENDEDLIRAKKEAELYKEMHEFLIGKIIGEK